MDTRKQLLGINRLLGDVFYPQTIRISALLSEYLDEAQLLCVKTEKLDGFLHSMLYGIRCRFASISEGMEMYAALCMHYGLDDAETAALLINAPEDVSRQDGIDRLAGKAIRRLSPTTKSNVLKQLACLAAREVLGIAALPGRPTRFELDSAHACQKQAIPPLTEESLQSITVTEEAISLKAVHQNINAAVGAERGFPSHIRFRTYP